MAIIGIKRPIAAPLTSDTPTYGTGFVVGKAIAARVALNGGEANNLNADDVPAESDSSFAGGTIELGIDDLADAVQAQLLGHTTVDGVVQSNANDSAIDIGLGYYKTRIKSGVRSYRATWYYKVRFTEPDDEAQTKGERIEWQTPTLNGNIVALPSGAWRDQKTFSAEADAIAWLENLANIGQPVDKAALDVKIGVVEALNPETYTSATWGPLYMSLQLADAVSTNTDATQTQVDAALADLTAKQAALVEA